MAKKVLLLMNLGSPESTSIKDIKTYLNEFLMDKRVIDLPYLLRLFLVKGIITRFRAVKTAAKYKTIWTKNGSPLIQITKELVEKIETNSGVTSYMCMRYGSPSPDIVLKKIIKENTDLEEIIFLPLYPHYALSSYETAVEFIKESFKKNKYSFNLNIVKPFYDHQAYIHALASTIKPYTEKDYDYVLFSYHGIPERQVRKTDPTKKHCLNSANCCDIKSDAHNYCYKHQVTETTKLVATHLNIPKDKYSIAYQSRLGLDKWLTPNSIDLFTQLPKQGVKNLLVVCPAFVSDCLETLEEIQEEGKELFLNAGGEKFTLIPCLNTNNLWIEAIKEIALKN